MSLRWGIVSYAGVWWRAANGVLVLRAGTSRGMATLRMMR